MESIFVLRPGALGDTILTLPALAALRAAFPVARIVFAGSSPWLRLLAGSAYANATISADDPSLAPLFGSLDRSAPAVRLLCGKPTLAVVWLRDHAAVVANLRALGARTMVAAPSRPPAGDIEHVADYLVGTLKLSPVSFPATPVLRPSREDEDWAASFWSEQGLAGARVVGLHPGSGGFWKCWPAERFAALSDVLAARGGPVVVVAGPADDEPLRAVLSASRNGGLIVVSGHSISRVAAILARCAAFVGNDSGVSHLAAALGTPSLALYGPTDPRVWGIRGANVRHLHAATLGAISVREVMEAFTALAKESCRPESPL